MKKILNVFIAILFIGCMSLSVVLFIKYKDLKKEYNNLSNDYNEIAEQNTTLFNNNSNLNNKVKDLESKYNTLQSDYDELQQLYTNETAVEYETPTDLSQYSTDITYEDIARTPDDYEGKALCYTGEVIQVLEIDGEIDLRVVLDEWWEDILLCGYDSKITDKRVLEGDTVTVYGIYYGVHTYESAFGTNITLPLLWLDHIEIN